MLAKENVRRLCIVLIVAFLFSASFVGCIQQKESSTETTSTQATSKTEVTKEFSYPMEGNRTLTYFGAQMPLKPEEVPDWAKGYDFWTQLQEKTGVTIKPYPVVAGNVDEQLNLLIVSGEQPDLIKHNWFVYPGGPEQAIRNGVIIKLNDVIDQYAPNLKAFLKANPEIDRDIKTDSGAYYAFPFIRSELQTVYGGIIARYDWMKELGLESPETVDEFYNFLKVLKESKNLEAPMTFEMRFLSPGYLSSGFDTIGDFYLENGKIKYGYLDPGYKQYLATLASWYKEGLLDKDIASIDRRTVQAKMTSGRAAVSLGNLGNMMGVYLDAMKGVDSSYDLTGLPTLTARKGELPKFGSGRRLYSGDHDVSISTNCKDIEAAARFLDYLFSPEGSMLIHHGTEGISYQVVNGEVVYTDLIMKNPDGLSPSKALGIFAQLTNFPMVQQGDSFFDYPQQVQARDVYIKSRASEHFIPTISATPEEADEIAKLYTAIESYVSENEVQFILGIKDISEYDNFIDQLKKLGIDRVLELKQKAYERYLKR